MTRKMRLLCLYAPHFPAAVVRKERPELAAVPLLLYRPEKLPVVAACCPLAYRAGARRGMRLSQALSLCPQGRDLPLEETVVKEEGDKVLALLLRYTEMVEAVQPGLALMDLAGLERSCGGEATLAHSLGEKVGQLGYEARLGIAGDRFAAFMAARWGRKAINAIPSGREKDFLARLSLSALPDRDGQWREMKRRLRLLGFTCLGEVAKLGQVAMQAQFGLPGREAWRLASGLSGPLRPLPLARKMERRRQFEHPLFLRQPLEAALAEMAAEIAAELRQCGLSCAALALSWQEEGRGEMSRHLTLKEPTRAVAAFLAAARPQLAEISGAVAALALAAEAVAPVAPRQLSLFAARGREERLLQLSAALERRWGERALCRVQWLGESHLEERTFTFAPLEA